jgi:hypothetical protein
MLMKISYYEIILFHDIICVFTRSESNCRVEVATTTAVKAWVLIVIDLYVTR